MIEDGYERRITLRSGEHAVHAIYRPATIEERQRFRWQCAFMNKRAAQSEINTWLARHLVMWDSSNPMSGKGLASFHGSSPEMYEQLGLAINGLCKDDSGETWRDVERDYSENLKAGLLLLWSSPRLATRDCGDCKTYWYSEQTGLPILNNDGTKMLRDGPTMCQTPEGCLKGTPEKTNALNKTNLWAWRHFRDCEAVGQFPNDPIVRRNASIIREAIKKHEKTK